MERPWTRDNLDDLRKAVAALAGKVDILASRDSAEVTAPAVDKLVDDVAARAPGDAGQAPPKLTVVKDPPAAASKPAAAKPAAAKPAAAAKPVATKPAATKPAATKPAATKPAAATKPVATKPAATKPVATKPAATNPVATKPAATKPVATKPAATKLAAAPEPAGASTSTAAAPANSGNRSAKPAATAMPAATGKAAANTGATEATGARPKEPWVGYDEQTVAEVRQGLAEADPSEVRAVLAYEAAHKNRRGVLAAAEATRNS